MEVHRSLAAVAAFVLATSWSARAEDEGPSFPPEWIQIESVYVGESLALLDGPDIKSETVYHGDWQLAFEADLEAGLGWRGASAILLLHNVHGRMLTDELGDLQGSSNIEAEPFTQLSELSLTQTFGEGFMIKAGIMDANESFAALDAAGTFMQSSFGVPPMIPITTFPDADLGAQVQWTSADSIAVSAGVYEGTPDGGRALTDERFRNGAMVLGEVVFRPTGGAYHVGAWIHTGDWTALDGSETFSSNHGVYMMVEQTVASWGADAAGGVVLFGQSSWAPDDRNEIDIYLGGGVLLRGLAFADHSDELGLGLAQARISDDQKALDGRDSEMVIEAYYRFSPLGNVAVQLDVQFIQNTGALPAADDAWVAGIRVEVKIP